MPPSGRPSRRPTMDGWWSPTFSNLPTRTGVGCDMTTRWCRWRAGRCGRSTRSRTFSGRSPQAGACRWSTVVRAAVARCSCDSPASTPPVSWPRSSPAVPRPRRRGRGRRSVLGVPATLHRTVTVRSRQSTFLPRLPGFTSRGTGSRIFTSTLSNSIGWRGAWRRGIRSRPAMLRGWCPEVSRRGSHSGSNSRTSGRRSICRPGRVPSMPRANSMPRRRRRGVEACLQRSCSGGVCSARARQRWGERPTGAPFPTGARILRQTGRQARGI